MSEMSAKEIFARGQRIVSEVNADPMGSGGTSLRLVCLAFEQLERKYAASLEVIEAARNSFYEWGDSTRENEQRTKRLAQALDKFQKETERGDGG